MQVPRSTDDAKDRFRALVPEADGVVIRPMFANLGAFVNGNMFAALLGDRIGVRLRDATARDELASAPGAGPFGPDGRGMGEYVSRPADDPARAGWIARGLEDVGRMPPKDPAAKGRSRRA